MENRLKELIAVGASIAANCQPCLQYHVGKAIEYGADEQAIKGAIETGRMVRKGAMAEMDKLVANMALAAPTPTSVASDGCGCGS